MTRAPSFTLLALLLASAASPAADVAVAPPPREIRTDGSRDPAPAAGPAKKEDPREVVERIIKNSNAVGDKLAMTDTGTDTRTTQDRILKDIDALLNPDDPPPKSDPNKDKKDDKQDKSDNKDKKDQKKDPSKNQQPDKNDQKDQKDQKKDMKGGGMGDPSPKKMDGEPMGGMGGTGEQQAGGDRPRERRPRQGEQQAKQPPKDPGMKPGGGGKQPKPDAQAGKPKDMTGGGKPDPAGDKMPPPGSPLVPIEDDVVKDVWGHLPDKLRQQATQYYKQEIMPRYAELLKRYYSSLAEKKP